MLRQPEGPISSGCRIRRKKRQADKKQDTEIKPSAGDLGEDRKVTVEEPLPSTYKALGVITLS